MKRGTLEPIEKSFGSWARMAVLLGNRTACRDVELPSGTRRLFTGSTT